MTDKERFDCEHGHVECAFAENGRCQDENDARRDLEESQAVSK